MIQVLFYIVGCVCSAGAAYLFCKEKYEDQLKEAALIVTAVVIASKLREEEEK